MILPDRNTKFGDFIASIMVDYNTLDLIIYPVKEDNWRKVCDSLANSPTFVRLGVPTTETFSSWQEWAKRFYNNAAR